MIFVPIGTCSVLFDGESDMEKKIIVNTLVRNEENFVWYAINSVLDFVDKMVIFDTGSTDKTVEIIKTINSQKIIFEELGEVDALGHSRLRDEQIKISQKLGGDWLLILDGDEIWPENTIRKFRQKIERASTEKTSLVVRAYNLVGDVYHYHPESETDIWPYAPKKMRPGFMTIRGISLKIPGLNCSRAYPMEAFRDKNGKPIHEMGEKSFIFLDGYYLHASYLRRSSIGAKVMNRGRKFEIGKRFSADFIYPKVFFVERPAIVPNVLGEIQGIDKLKSLIQTPLKKIKRKIFTIAGFYFKK